MKFGKKNGDDPSSRRRLSAEQAHTIRAEILRLHAAGLSVREIARAVGKRTSVHRVIQEFRRSDVDAELDAIIAGYDDGMRAEDVADRPDQWHRLNALERHRVRYLR
jgi:IS30 family transposase